MYNFFSKNQTENTITYQFSGHASFYNVKDQQDDIVLAGAFSDSLAQWQKQKCLPHLLWQHDTKQPIGKINRFIDDQESLKIHGELFLTLQQGFEASALVAQGGLDGLSIGFQVINATRDKTTGCRLIHKARLWEVSLVTFPANLKTRIKR